MTTTPNFPTLKSHILALATALYGTHSTPTQTFDVLPFSSPRRTPKGTALNSFTHGAALIYYTGPRESPYVSWEMLSYVDGQGSVETAAQRLVEDMQKGVGDVIGGLVKSGDWAVRHTTVPDVAIGEQHGDGEAEGRGDGLDGDEYGEKRWGQPLGNIDEGEEEQYRGRSR